MKPSETICPESVAVMLALCPEQIKARANMNAGATLEIGQYHKYLLSGNITFPQSRSDYGVGIK